MLISKESILLKGKSITQKASRYAVYWGGALSGVALLQEYLKRRLSQSMSDSAAADSIEKCFNKAMKEQSELYSALLIDLKRKLSSSSSIFKIEEIMSKLDQLKSETGVESGKRKIELWTDLKTAVISRMIVFIYSQSLLAYFGAISAGLIGKCQYYSSILQGVSHNSTEDFLFACRLFSHLSHRFIQYGLDLLSKSVMNSVSAVMQKVNLLQEPVSYVLLDSLIKQIRHEVESDCGKNIFDECLFYQLDRVLESEGFGVGKRRLFMAMITNSKDYLHDSGVKNELIQSVTDQIELMLNSLIQSTTDQQQRDVSIPFIVIIPKINKYYQEYSLSNVNNNNSQLVRLSAKIFVEAEGELHQAILHSCK